MNKKKESAVVDALKQIGKLNYREWTKLRDAVEGAYHAENGYTLLPDARIETAVKNVLNDLSL